MVTRTYTLDQVNEGYADLAAGRILRGAIVFQEPRPERRGRSSRAMEYRSGRRAGDLTGSRGGQ
ncbi:hypothetical protein [Frankia sp. AgB32]|uniref:hypothetical protein n=1 Tax=Frankia sp. AgB32 TaxID=631119 RepID=UPI00200CEB39|nr:hypothetical protein [Frankia sp. AgB32]MCK9898290.1 hypothetical protein [Frankia sp. AgB32]